jgi:hypothetical protein
MNKELEKKEHTAQELLLILKSKGLSIAQIAQLMENKINKRTLFRWIKGDAIPQRRNDVEKLQSLVDSL